MIDEDTDLLILLCHQPSTENNIYFTSDKNTNQIKIWNINETKSILTKIHLIIYAFTDCDTTTRLYGIGKGKVLKTKYDQKQSYVFMKKDASHEDIARAGEMKY